MPPGRRFVLLDRDGTINVERNYLDTAEGVELLPGAVEGLRALRALGLGLVVITNQSGLGRGLFSLGTLQAIHARLEALLEEAGVRLDGIYWCPHVPDDGCRCRKPRPGLVHRAARDLGFDPARAFVIGDKRADIELGRGIGATTILVTTGYGAAERLDPAVQPDAVAADLPGAAEEIRRRILGSPQDTAACGPST
jgi:D-glycero-D-manno-heptose 1,7-bisphosphate phosphatase